MAEFRDLASMALSDDELYDMTKARTGDARPDLPEYPPGMCFTVREGAFARLGIGDEAKPGATVKFAAFARVTSVNLRTDGCRIELELMLLKLDDGEFVELDEGERPSICLNENDHERLDLDEATAERGHILHLIGDARVMSADDTTYGGRSVSLQIEECAIEDEDQEGADE